MIDGKHTLCGCSMADYLECESNLGIPDDSSEAKAVKYLSATLGVHVIIGRVQRGEASFSCFTNSSLNLASYCWQ